MTTHGGAHGDDLDGRIAVRLGRDPLPEDIRTRIFHVSAIAQLQVALIRDGKITSDALDDYRFCVTRDEVNEAGERVLGVTYESRRSPQYERIDIEIEKRRRLLKTDLQPKALHLGNDARTDG